MFQSKKNKQKKTTKKRQKHLPCLFELMYTCQIFKTLSFTVNEKDGYNYQQNANNYALVCQCQKLCVSHLMHISNDLLNTWQNKVGWSLEDIIKELQCKSGQRITVQIWWIMKLTRFGSNLVL